MLYNSLIITGKLYPHLGRLLWVGGGKLSLLMYLCTVVLASLAYFRWVESPLHRASRRWVQRLLSR